jgi:cyclase
MADAELTCLSSHAWAYVQGAGTFGFSNAGIVAAGGEALLVDTLFDLAHTRRMLDTIASEVAVPIRTVVNTHHNGDHCWGNQLLPDARILAHSACAEAMPTIPPDFLQALKRGAVDTPAGRYLARLLSDFDFTGVDVTPPTETFDSDYDLDVGGMDVHLLYVGPAHTAGDVVVHLPDDGVVFAGDIVFRLCTPIGWEGTFANWIAALERIAALDVDTIVPGHGPVCGLDGVHDMRDYLEYTWAEAARCYAAGLSLEDAVHEIDLGPYATWAESERLVFQVERAYRELDGGRTDLAGDFMRCAAIMAGIAGAA